MGGHFRSASRRKPQRGFTLLEVLIALGILTFGLLGLLVILQDTLLKTEPVEFETKAALIAQSILDGIRSDPSGFPFIPGLNPGTWPMVDTASRIYEEDGYLLNQAGGSYQLSDIRAVGGTAVQPFIVFNVPGDGADNDAQFDELSSSSLAVSRWRDDFVPGVPNNGIDNQMDRLFNGTAGAGSRRDYDGTIEDDVASSYLGIGSLLFPPQDRDGDGFVTISGTIFKDSGDSGFVPSGNFVSFGEAMNHPGSGVGGGAGHPYRPDGDFSYDPQRGLDEELPDGRDNDGDTLVDEDTALASQLRNISGVSLQNPYSFVPHLAGNGLDDDGDSEDFTDLNGNGLPDVSIPNIQPEAEEGVDPLTGLIYADGIDNNGVNGVDERIDEEIYDGLDNDSDGLIDEDCRAATFPFKPIPLPKPNEDYSFQISARRVPAGGDGVDNDGDNAQRVSEGRDYNLNGTAGDPAEGIDEEFFDGIDDDRDGLVDEDVKAYAAPNTLLVTVSIFRGDDRIDNDGDGYIDEEPVDGIDNDFDVSTDPDEAIDEDFYVDVFRTSGLVTFSE
jgi:prepilin-type N-terminal cleavage/methylation domain-containing protein